MCILNRPLGEAPAQNTWNPYHSHSVLLRTWDLSFLGSERVVFPELNMLSLLFSKGWESQYCSRKYKGWVQPHSLFKDEQCSNDRAMAAAEKKQLPCINHRVFLAHCIHWRAVHTQQPPATTGQWGGDAVGRASVTARLCTKRTHLLPSKHNPGLSSSLPCNSFRTFQP